MLSLNHKNFRKNKKKYAQIHLFQELTLEFAGDILALTRQLIDEGKLSGEASFFFGSIFQLAFLEEPVPSKFNPLVLGDSEELAMPDQYAKVSNAFLTFKDEAPEHATAWMNLVQSLSAVNALDSKTGELAYIAVLAALRIVSGIPFHVVSAKKLGATREEVISAILVGLPLAGNVVTQALPAAVAAYDED